MTTTQTAAGVTVAVTAAYDFHNATPNGDKLFCVREGIPLSYAFDQLSALISSAQSAIEGLDDEDEGSSSKWCAVHVLEFSHALVQAMHGGLKRGKA